MKDLYIKPKIEIEEFKTVDVVTTSSDGDTNPDTDITVPWS